MAVDDVQEIEALAELGIAAGAGRLYQSGSSSTARAVASLSTDGGRLTCKCALLQLM